MGTGARQNENGRETDGTEQLSHPGKVVVVAGSSQGIGRGLAVGLARCAPLGYYAAVVLTLLPFAMIPVALGCVLIRVIQGRRPVV